MRMDFMYMVVGGSGSPMDANKKSLRLVLERRTNEVVKKEAKMSPGSVVTIVMQTDAAVMLT
jgi:DNA recombination-dependent growth factor C